MTLATIEKRLSQLENKKPGNLKRVHSFDFEKYEDFLVEAKKAHVLFKERIANGEIVAIGIVPQASELRECLQRMEAARMDKELIECVRAQLQRREDEDRKHGEI